MNILPLAWSKIQGETAFFSYLYGLGVRLRLIAYRRKKRESLPGFVVSIGNLTVGGTGKTPAACMLAEWASGEGYRVVILSRGYGGRHKKRVLEVSDGNDINVSPAEAGDEPYLLARKLRGVPVIISKKRHLAGLLAHKKFGANFYILDDGFQHLALERDLNLVLIDALNPFGNGHLLPWGPLREPLDQLERADAFIITRFVQGASGHNLMDFLRRTFPGKPLFQSGHIPDQIVFPNIDKAYGPDFLKGKRAIAFAGIAKPQVFKDTLVKLGVELAFFRGFRDHHSFSHAEIRDLMAKKERLEADCLLTTEKDWVRIENLVKGYPDLAYLTIKFTLLSGVDKFFKMVNSLLEQNI
ncbi:MAG: tetraacyldisaccharide 4'-kinase [Deltaproteobacteria bacterium]|nr:tetraacyldisaccharide 4'-kinase [Deltaproteobacteria bacterium]